MKQELDFRLLEKNSPELKEAVQLYVDVFRNETITDLTYNFDKEKTRAQYSSSVLLTARIYIEKGHDIFIVKKKQRIIGVAIIKNPENKVKKPSLNILFPDILKLLPLLTKVNYKNTFQLSKTVELATPIDPNFVTLSAIAISKDFQGQGVGSLFIKIIHRFYAKQSNGIYLYTAEEKTKDLYLKLGYELIEQNKAKNLTVFHLIYKF